MNARLFAALRTLVFATAFMSLWLWFIPRWIAAGKRVAFSFEPGVVSMILMIVGGVIGLRCVFDFVWTGRGTPAPFDPPKKLVVTGFYRWVRNPMYVSLVVLLVGEALALPGIRIEMLILVAAVWLVTTLFVMLYEEPKLRALFGDDYVEYCRHVHRWLPRIRPYNPERPFVVGSAHLE